MVTQTHITNILSYLSESYSNPFFINPLGFNSFHIRYYKNSCLKEFFVPLNDTKLLQDILNTFEREYLVENFHRIKYNKYNNEVLFTIGILNWRHPYITFSIKLDTCG